MVDQEDITEEDNNMPLSPAEEDVIKRYYKHQTINKFDMKGLKVLALILLSLILLGSFMGSVFAQTGPAAGHDTILSPLNNSQLAYVGSNTTYPLTYYIGNIEGNVTHEEVGIYVNGLLYNISNRTADGSYTVPLKFYSQGTYAVSLESTGQNNTVTFVYTVTQNQSLIFGHTLEFWLLLIAAAIIFIAIAISIFRNN